MTIIGLLAAITGAIFLLVAFVAGADAKSAIDQILAAILAGFGFILGTLGIALGCLESHLKQNQKRHIAKLEEIRQQSAMQTLLAEAQEQNLQKIADAFEGRRAEVEQPE